MATWPEIAVCGVIVVGFVGGLAAWEHSKKKQEDDERDQHLREFYEEQDERREEERNTARCACAHPESKLGVGICAPTIDACWSLRDQAVRNGAGLKGCDLQLVMTCFDGTETICVPTREDCEERRDAALRELPKVQFTPCVTVRKWPG